MTETVRDYLAIDAVVNIQTAEALAHRPKDREAFYQDKIGVDDTTYGGIPHKEMLHRMDAGGVGHVFIDHFRQAKGRADGIQIQCAANGAVQRGA